jgi:hypothetical protein
MPENGVFFSQGRVNSARPLAVSFVHFPRRALDDSWNVHDTRVYGDVAQPQSPQSMPTSMACKKTAVSAKS